jgi:ferredoxin
LTKGPKIVASKCNGCGLCVSVCRCGALVVKDDRVEFIEMEDCKSCSECKWCGQCELICPEGAISYQFDIVSEEA